MDALFSASPTSSGIVLKLSHSTSGQPRMVYSFDFISPAQLEDLEIEGHGEAVALTASEFPNKTLYVHQTAFMKVLSATLDFDAEKSELYLQDKEGNAMDPNH